MNRSNGNCCRDYNRSWLLVLAIAMLFIASRSAQSQTLGTPRIAVEITIVAGLQEVGSQAVVAEEPPEESQTGDKTSAESGESVDAAPVQDRVAEVADATFSSLQTTSSLQSTSIEVDGPAVQSQEPHPLSVEPSSQMLPKDRPSWIDSDPDFESEVHRFVVASIPTSLKGELDSNLEATLVAALRNYVNQQYGLGTDAMLDDRLTASFIQTNLVDDNKTYVAEMQTGEGILFQKWVMVEITPKQRAEIQLWISQQLQRQRLLPLGFGLGGFLTLLGLSHLLLRRKSSIPDNLKATHFQPKNSPVQFVASPAVCRRSRCKGFGMMTAIFIAVAVAWLVASPEGSSRKGKRSVNRRHDVELRVAPRTDSPGTDSRNEICEV